MIPKYSKELEYLASLDSKNIKLGLDRILSAAKALKDPQNDFPSVIVAGTNGKGSTCAFLESIFRKHGLKVGLFISPHLIDVRERIQINRKLISKADFAKYSAVVRKGVSPSPLEGEGGGEGTLKLTYFEFLTALAFKYFSEKKVDIAVLEVGLGGRFDATNIVTPLVSVITRIGIDHEKYLGNTIEKIAFEKAGVIKKGIPCVTIVQEERAMNVVRDAAEKNNSNLYVVSPLEGFGNPSLKGKHQLENSALAGRAAMLVMEILGREFSKKTASEAVADTKWEGRLDVLSKVPLVIADGAHNLSGARALADFIKKELAGKKITLVLGIMADKDASGILSLLVPLADNIIATAPKNPRSMKPVELKKLCEKFGAKKVEIAESVSKGLKMAITQIPPSPPLQRGERGDLSFNKAATIISGSLYTVGEALKKFAR